MPNVVPIIDVGHKYQPPSVNLPIATQMGFRVASVFSPTVTAYCRILVLPQISSLLPISTVFMEVGYEKVTFQ